MAPEQTRTRPIATRPFSKRGLAPGLVGSRGRRLLHCLPPPRRCKTTDDHPKAIVIVGQMGAGKTTVGRILAGRLDRPFFDGDEQIQEITGRTSREIAESHGVPALHALELSVLLMALEDSPDAIVAAAASVVDRPTGRDAIADTTCIWIDRQPDESEGPGEGHRREVDPDENLERRRPLFKEFADLVLSGPGGPEEYVDRAIEHLRQ